MAVRLIGNSEMFNLIPKINLGVLPTYNDFPIISIDWQDGR